MVHLVHTPSPVPATQIFTYGTASDPTPHNNPPNMLTNIPADPDSDPGLSDSSLSDSSDSFDDEYYKRIRCEKI